MRFSVSGLRFSLSDGAGTRVIAACLLFGFATLGVAAPGAHGPNGEHLDGPPAAHTRSGFLRFEANTDAFELVAELRSGELAIVLDRYDTNEPVLGASIEVEAGAIKARAAFRPDQGDYAVTDPVFIKALSVPGEHSLVFTILAGRDNDLLDATFRNMAVGGIRASEPDHGHARAPALWGAVGAGCLVLVGGFALWRQRQRRKTAFMGSV